jgi:hypothetical protein
VIDLFIAHAWRFHPEWISLADVIENHYIDVVRNFSLPWHDPAISPNSDYGKNFLINQLKSQIMPTKYVVLISDLFKVESNLRWLKSSVDFGLEGKKMFLIVGNFEDIETHVVLDQHKLDIIESNNFKDWLNNLLA